MAAKRSPFAPATWALSPPLLLYDAFRSMGQLVSGFGQEALARRNYPAARGAFLRAASYLQVRHAGIQDKRSEPVLEGGRPGAQGTALAPADQRDAVGVDVWAGLQPRDASSTAPRWLRSAVTR